MPPAPNGASQHAPLSLRVTVVSTIGMSGSGAATPGPLPLSRISTLPDDPARSDNDDTPVAESRGARNRQPSAFSLQQPFASQVEPAGAWRCSCDTSVCDASSEKTQR